ncbi:hypothetical protein V6N12_009357 [Hibiscus sabdariffa]|uniref:RNase H type-1 domain-containing protein n=1 Tax=Hibiscus sabdariffa TaxID=183260 RepID=A0ABR2E8V1_9ROSI
MGSIGGLARDSNGHWIIGFCRSVGVVSAFNTELWVIYIGFQLARDNGFQKVQIHSDCLKAVTTVQDDAAGSNSNPLVRAIVKLRRGNWDTEVEWIPRESNRPADKLTKQADEAQHKLLMLETPPENLLSLLENDITDSSFHFAI